MADSTLAAIERKVRRLTRSPSESQITTTEIDEYINTFVLYDFPEHLRLFALRKTLTFYTKPNVAVYETNGDINDPLYNFRNIYITTHDPIYVNGKQVQFTQSGEKFYAMFPISPQQEVIGTGNGTAVAFAGTFGSIGTPILPGSVIISAVSTNGTAMQCNDESGLGALTGDNAIGTINYLTGKYSVHFSLAPGAGQAVNASGAPYTPSIPLAIYYFDDKFILRPVPDKAYSINMEVYVRPSELLSSGSSPYLEQWWQYIAYGAAKKIFEDRFDMDSVQAIMPEFKTQETLVNRTSIVQMAKERVMTIFSQANSDW